MSASGHARILNGQLERHGVDLEPLAAKALTDARLHQTPHDREDLLAYLIAEAWKASEEYDPRHGLAFSTFAYRRLRQRTIDWIRDHETRTRYATADGIYERSAPTVLSLDAPVSDDDRGTLGETLAASALDPEPVGDPDLRRRLDARASGSPARTDQAAGQRHARRSRRRTPARLDFPNLDLGGLAA